MDGLLHTLVSRDEDNGASRGRRALVVTAVLTAFSTVIVAMRLYARLGLMKITGREDWAILISLVRLPCSACTNRRLTKHTQVFSLIYLSLVAAREFHIHCRLLRPAPLTSILELHYGMGIHSAVLSSHVLQQQLKVCFIEKTYPPPLFQSRY